MERKDYRIFSQGRIGSMMVKNRLVRSATADIIWTRKVTDRIITIHNECVYKHHKDLYKKMKTVE